MSDWKSRAIPVSAPSGGGSDWRSRATPLSDPNQPPPQAIGTTNGPTPAAKEEVDEDSPARIWGYGNVPADRSVSGIWRRMTDPMSESARELAQAVAMAKETGAKTNVKQAYADKINPPINADKIIDDLPKTGMMVGGMTSGPLAPIGAGLGYAGGDALKVLANHFRGKKDPELEDYLTNEALDVPVGAAQDYGARLLGKGAEKLAKPVGKAIYRSGFKTIDALAKRFGSKGLTLEELAKVRGEAAPEGSIWGKLRSALGGDAEQVVDQNVRPSDVLMRNRVVGNAEEQYHALQDVADELQFKNEAIAKAATRNGGQPLMEGVKKGVAKTAAEGAELAPTKIGATDEAQALVDRWRKNIGPNGDHSAVDAFQAEIDAYKRAGAQPGGKTLQELPHTKETPDVFVGPNPEDELHLGTGPKLNADGEEIARGQSTGRLQQNQVIKRLDANGKPIVNVKPLTKKPGEPVIDSWRESDLVKPDRAELPDTITRKQVMPVGTPKETLPAVSGEPVGTVTAERPLQPDVINKLPVQGKYVPGPRAPQIEVGEVDVAPKMGPTTSQVKHWNAQTGANVGRPGWDQLAASDMGKQFEKAMHSGTRKAIERSVDESLGQEAGNLYRANNTELGPLLDVQKNARALAEQEAKKNGLTQVDGILLHDPAMFIGKKLVERMNTPGARTRMGRNLMDWADQGLIAPTVKTGVLAAPMLNPWSHKKEER